MTASILTASHWRWRASNGWQAKPGAIVRAIEISSAVAAIGLIVLAAAMPDGNDKPQAQAQQVSGATSTNPPYTPGRESTFGAYLGAP